MSDAARERVRKIGRAAYIREEMVRLGYWPPSPQVAEKEAATVEQLRALYDELGKARKDLEAVAKEIADVTNIEKTIAEIRRRRIERVRAKREERRTARAAEEAARRERDTKWRAATLPFLGAGVSAGLTFEGGNPERTARLGLPALATASDIASAIGVTEREVAWLSYHRAATRVDHYHRFTIPKRRGGERVISSPKKRLRAAQNWLLADILDKLPAHPAAMAFRPGLSIADNARHHAGKTLVVRVDLKDFFPSIGLPRVKRLFTSCGYNEGVATILALLCTEVPRAPIVFDGERRFVAIGKRGAPQGACTSPAIANLVCVRMDVRLAGAAAKLGFTYTRYADDLIFSHFEWEGNVGMLLGAVRRIIVDTGFVINEEKTVILRPHERQSVTGLVVNRTAGATTPRISRDDLRRFRAFLHRFEKHGPVEMSQRLGQDARAYASGYLSFIHMVSPEKARAFQEKHPWLAKR